MLMLTTITLVLSTLVVINLLLLRFSCNKIIKPVKTSKKPVILRPHITLAETSEMLAPTGS